MLKGRRKGSSAAATRGNEEGRTIEWRPHRDAAPEEAQRKDAEEVVRGSGINFLGNFGKLSKSLYYVVITRFLGAEAFGLYTLGWSLIDFTGKFGLFGLDRGVLRFVSQRRIEGDAEGCAVCEEFPVRVWAAAPWVAAPVFHHPELSPILRILGLSIPFLVGSSILLAALKAVRIMKFDVYVRSLAEPFILLVSAAALCALGWTLPGLAFAYLIAAACGLILSIRFFGRVFSPSRLISGMGLPRAPLVSFCAPLPLHDALSALMSRIDLFILAAFLPAASVGVYAATCEVAWVVKDIRQAVDPIFAPVASGLIHEGKRERLSALFASVTRWIVTLELAFLLSVGLWGGWILSVFGPAFAAGFWGLVLLSAAYALNGAFGSSEMLLMMSGRSGLNLLNTVLLAAVTCGLNLLLIPRHGIAGAALAAALSLTLINLLRIVQVRVCLGIHPFRRSLIKPFAAAGPAFAVGLFLMRLGAPWAYLSFLSLPLYFGLVRALGLEAGDRDLLEKLHDKLPLLRRWARVWDRVGAQARKASGRLFCALRPPPKRRGGLKTHRQERKAPPSLSFSPRKENAKRSRRRRSRILP